MGWPALTFAPGGDYHSVDPSSRRHLSSGVVMHNRCRALAVVSALVVSITAGGNAFAQQKGGKVDKAQQAEIAAATKIIDDTLNGQAAPSDYKFSFVCHPMKGADTRTYVPFLLTFEKGQVLPPAAVYYVRVVSQDNLVKAKKAITDHEDAVKKAAMAAKLDPENTELADEEEKVRAQTPKVEYTFEDLKNINVATQKDSTFVLPLMMAVAPGEYDTYFLFKETQAGLKNKKQPAKAGVVKVTLKIPDFATPEFGTSSIVVTKITQPLKAAPTAADYARNPYIFGNMAVVPSLDFKFAKADELTVLFYIYNAGLDKAGKPDVTVDYNFYQKTGDAEKFFNKTPALELNAKTLPANFDVKAGHQLNGGQGLPLASFPEGDYRLELKIVDKVTGKTKTESVRFTVTP
jgi:hypothetical protein